MAAIPSDTHSPVTNFGESHGPAIGCVIDGCPPGMDSDEADIQIDLDRRRPAPARHVTQRNEPDAVQILTGVYQGRTTGTPIALLIHEHRPAQQGLRQHPRHLSPGHADYAYFQKYGVARPARRSPFRRRLTAPMVAAAHVAASG